MSNADSNRLPIDRAAEPSVLTPRVLACAWMVLGVWAIVGILKTHSSVDSILTGLMVVCTVMAMPLLGVLQARHFHRMQKEAEHRLLQQEAQARRAAEEASRAKSDFISVMSHEIRTPLNGIVGLVTLVQDERVDAETRYQYLRMLEQSSQALSNLVSGVLDFSQIEAGGIELLHEPFSIKRWVQDLEGSFSASATVKGLFLQVELDASVGEDAMGDAGRLRQIAAHYISNAIKFTKAGTIRVRISRPRGDDLLRLEVRDSGIGLTDTAQQALFKPRQHQGARVQREFGGAGLGLSICERLAQRMGGTVGVHSLPGVGSTFWAEVQVPALVRGAPPTAPLFEHDDDQRVGAEPPLQALGERDATIHRQPLTAFNLDAARVLVVDDNAVNRTTTSQMLRRMNAIVATANDGQEGLDAMRSADAEGWPFDLVLMDVQMPGMDGLTAVGLLRADPALQHTPVVALTAGVLKEDVTRAIEAGMDGFLAKPVTAERLGRNVAHFADVGRQRRRTDQHLKF